MTGSVTPRVSPSISYCSVDSSPSASRHFTFYCKFHYILPGIPGGPAGPGCGLPGSPLSPLAPLFPVEDKTFDGIKFTLGSQVYFQMPVPLYFTFKSCVSNLPMCSNNARDASSSR